jgi:flagellar biosynthetic protein FliP
MRLLLLLLVVLGLPAGEAGLATPSPLAPVAPAPAAPVAADGKDPTLAAPPNAVAVNAGGLVVSVGSADGKGFSSAVQLMLLITVLAIAPSFLMMMTSFTRIIIVLGFLRRALGTQTLPPNQVMVGLALFLTLFIMAPTLKRVNDQAVQPYLADAITQQAAVDLTKDAVRDFMLKHTRKADLALFIRLAKEERPRTAADVSFVTLVPAFITSELKTAFQMGFILFLPFLVIDLVISAVLMALGMMMLPPVVVSLPFKILIFVLVDGWTLLMQGLVASYG